MAAALRTRSTLLAVSVAVLAGACLAPSAGAASVAPTGGDFPGDQAQVTLWRGRPVACPDESRPIPRPGVVVSGRQQACFRLARRVMTIDRPRDVRVMPGRPGEGWEVVVTFNAHQRREFARVTGAAIGHELAILDGDRLLSAPMVMDRIDLGQLDIVSLTQWQARHLAKHLEQYRLTRP